MEQTWGRTWLQLKRGDLTEENTDAIVNAANPSLMGGGGVDGAIHSTGGGSILEECKAIHASQGPLPAGQAVITTAGRLPARFVIHTVGPIWAGGRKGEAGLLESCYRNSLILAVNEGLRTVAFPSISTGAYGYPLEKAAPVALSSVIDFLTAEQNRDENGQPLLDRVCFCLFSESDYSVYSQVLVDLESASEAR